MDEITIYAEYDRDARVWVAEYEPLGLATEAGTLEVLTYKLQEMVPELADLNGYKGSRPVRFNLVSNQQVEAFS